MTTQIQTSVTTKHPGLLLSGERTVNQGGQLVQAQVVHLHKCRCGKEWECDSPYCTSLFRAHPECNGIDPIVLGYEPWRH